MIETIGAILFVYIWAGVAVLSLFMYLIGRLYELKFQRRSYYRLFLVPLVLFLLAAVPYLFLSPAAAGSFRRDFVGLVVPDFLFLIGGVILVGLCYSLQRIMIARKG